MEIYRDEHFTSMRGVLLDSTRPSPSGSKHHGKSRSPLRDITSAFNAGPMNCLRSGHQLASVGQPAARAASKPSSTPTLAKTLTLRSMR
ncbi:hypothetical protein ACKKBG_A17800 [Auxenochlorella protothecoides x Auxenochlorella symbiontica]